MRCLTTGSGVIHGFCDTEAAVCAVVKCARPESEEHNEFLSEIFVPHCTEIGGFTNERVTHLKFFLADVKTFEGPVAVISDVRGLNNGHFVLKKRTI